LACTIWETGKIRESTLTNELAAACKAAGATFKKVLAQLRLVLHVEVASAQLSNAMRKLTVSQSKKEREGFSKLRST
jgi:hypothetical protein